MTDQFFSGWTFWLGHRGKEYDKGLEKSASFSCLREFGNIWKGTPLGRLSHWFPDTVTGQKYLFQNGKEEVGIEAVSVFRDYIEPLWEDALNAGKGEFCCQLLLRQDELDGAYEKAVVDLISEGLPFSESLNGIRFCDKSKMQTKLFKLKIEFWVAFGQQQKEKIEQTAFEIAEAFSSYRLEGKVLFRGH